LLLAKTFPQKEPEERESFGGNFDFRFGVIKDTAHIDAVLGCASMSMSNVNVKCKFM